jgi:hypothetical protein
MFGRQIRQAGLIVTSMAFALTVLASPATQAMAQESIDSIDTIPVSLSVGEAETMLAGPQIPQLAVDLRLIQLSHTMNAVGGTEYRFRVHNNSSNSAKFEVSQRYDIKHSGAADEVHYDTWQYILGGGATVDGKVDCTAYLGGQCKGGAVWLSKIFGVDTDTSNNQPLQFIGFTSQP